MQDCKPVISNNVQNNIPPVNEAYTTSPVQPSWEHYQFNADSKPQNPLRSMHENSHSNQSGPSVPQPYVVQASWDERSSPASFSASVASGNQSVADAFSLERPDYHFPQTALSQAPGVAGCPVYMAGQFLRPQFEDAQSNTACTPVDLSTSPRSHAQSSVQQHYNQAIYHVQPGNAPPGMFAPDANMQVPVDTEASFRPGVAAHQNQASYSVHPTSCYQQSETGQIVFSYPEFRPGTEFQAPARIERGFTGHGSGVGGGAFT